ncbi:MAG: hypothetical protein ACYS7Y_36710 [Planctomycetota bacterium]|jgi:hypothetical protein
MEFASICMLFELFAVAVVIIATVYILQSNLLKAHHLLRLGLSLIAGASALEFYEIAQHVDENHVHTVASVLENVGQAVLYTWVALSKRLWAQIHAIGE